MAVTPLRELTLEEMTQVACELQGRASPCGVFIRRDQNINNTQSKEQSHTVKR